MLLVSYSIKKKKNLNANPQIATLTTWSQRERELCNSVSSAFTPEAAALLLYAKRWKRDRGGRDREMTCQMAIKHVMQRSDGFALLRQRRHWELCQVLMCPHIKNDWILSNSAETLKQAAKKMSARTLKQNWKSKLYSSSAGRTVYDTERDIDG